MRIFPIPALTSNYIWVLHNQESAYVVDPGDAQAVIDYLQPMRLTLAGILLTHRHADHVGGVDQLLRYAGAVKVFGPKSPSMPYVNVPLRADHLCTLEEIACSFRVIEVPGHTIEHIAYVFEDADVAALFCGDTLFSAGCGRVFDGTVEQLYASLNKLCTLPLQTRVFCTHEYTADNLRFALTVEPNNVAAHAYQNKVRHLRQKNLPTLPSSLAQELEVNPFLRVQQPEIQHTLLAKHALSEQDTDALSVFSALRRLKDRF